MKKEVPDVDDEMETGGGEGGYEEHADTIVDVPEMSKMVGFLVYLFV